MTLLDDFIDTKRNNGVKEQTIKQYRLIIEWVLRTARECRLNDDPVTMTANEFRLIIKNMNLLSNSINTTVTIFKMFLRFVGNPLDVRFLTNNESPNAKWISEDDFIRTFRECDDPTVKIILHLGGNYGLRRVEISRLTFDDIKDGMMKVLGKGHGNGKYRLIPLLKDDMIIEEYIQWRLSIMDKVKNDRSHGRLVVTYCDNNMMITDLKPQSITQKMRKYFREHGIDATTHSLRREFVTTMYRSGADLITIQRLVGHESPQTTERYIQNDKDTAIQAINQRNLYISLKLMS